MQITTSRDIGNLIRQQRKSLGWSQAKLAEKTMVSRDWIIQLEKGKDTAELGLILRAIRTVGLSLDLAPQPAPSAKNLAVQAMLKKLVS